MHEEASVFCGARFDVVRRADGGSTRPTPTQLKRFCAHGTSWSLELVRHTPTYSPPVASRSFAYLGVTAFEAVATGSSEMQSLAGQLNGLTACAATGSGQDL